VLWCIVDLVGNVKDCDCIIVEDIIDTGFTIARAAEGNTLPFHLFGHPALLIACIDD
jgi:hypothetical protein